MAKKTILNAKRINDLKKRVKEECKRRSKEGSVAAYGGESYDYTKVPGSKIPLLAEHYNKLATPLNAINKDKITNTNAK